MLRHGLTLYTLAHFLDRKLVKPPLFASQFLVSWEAQVRIREPPAC